MSRTFHLIVYPTLVVFILFQLLLITGYDNMNDALLTSLDGLMKVCK